MNKISVPKASFITFAQCITGNYLVFLDLHSLTASSHEEKYFPLVVILSGFHAHTLPLLTLSFSFLSLKPPGNCTASLQPLLTPSLFIRLSMISFSVMG